MGARKHNSAEARKEALKQMYFAKLRNVPTSPRKMRLVADMIRKRVVISLLFQSRHFLSAVEDSQENLATESLVERSLFIGHLTLQGYPFQRLEHNGSILPSGNLPVDRSMDKTCK